MPPNEGQSPVLPLGGRFGPFPQSYTNPFIKSSENTSPIFKVEQATSLNQNAETITKRWEAAQADSAEKANVLASNQDIGVGTSYYTEPATVTEKGSGSLAKKIRPRSGKGLQNIVNDFTWTASNVSNRTDIPYIQLKEHEVDGGQIQQQLAFYAQGLVATAENIVNANAGNNLDVLHVYEEIFPRNPTGFVYKFPYFSKSYFELSTPQWQQFDKIGAAAEQVAEGAKDIATTLFGSNSKIGKGIGLLQQGASLGANLGMTTLNALYPVVGVADRPRVFTSHVERTVKIEFPLYNTLHQVDWIQNKDFIYLFGAQNLFNKRNFITGMPPVWYEVYVPGSYYSVASCVTQFDVQNLGNIRILQDNGHSFTVPDAYQISISLTEMALPSRNQFQAANSKTGANRVSVDSAGGNNNFGASASTVRNMMNP